MALLWYVRRRSSQVSYLRKCGAKKMPTVSVIINTYNRSLLLSRAIDSVLRDVYIDKEIIVVDDCSTDETTAMVKKYLHLENFNYVKNSSNMGLACSRNLGVEKSSGKYIAFLDDDDEWADKSKLTEQVRYLENSSDKRVFLVATSILKKYGDGRIEEFVIEKPIDEKKNILRGNGVLYPSTVLMKKECLDLIGGFDPKFSRGVDSDIYRNLILNHGLIYEILPNLTVLYTEQGNDSITIMNSYKKAWNNAIANFYVVEKYFRNYLQNPSDLFYRIKSVVTVFIRLLIKRI